MARIRTIKPEFFTSEDIVSLSPMARLLYIALWCEADKEGRMVWKPTTFKLRYLPGDSCDVHALCNELVSAGLVCLYGEGFAYIPAFSRHQHINPRESISTLPAPDGFVPDRPRKIAGDVREEVMERDGRKCVRCNATTDLTLDHILPQSLSGPHIAENLRCMCRSCNSARPVSGQGLADDLAIDGFSVAYLRAKFGIDASPRVGTRAILDKHAQGGREGKGREGIEGASGRVAKKTPLPENFSISERVAAWAEEKGHTNLDRQLEALVSHAKRNGAKYVDWDEALMNAIRHDWAKVNGKSVGRSDDPFAGAH